MDSYWTLNTRPVVADLPRTGTVPEPVGPPTADDATTVYELASQLEHAAGRERVLREQLLEVHRQLAERDALIGRLAGAPDAPAAPAREHLEPPTSSADLDAERRARLEERERSAGEREQLLSALAGARGELAELQATRAWRAARIWWRLKARSGVG